MSRETTKNLGKQGDWQGFAGHDGGPHGHFRR